MEHDVIVMPPAVPEQRRDGGDIPRFGTRGEMHFVESLADVDVPREEELAVG